MGGGFLLGFEGEAIRDLLGRDQGFLCGLGVLGWLYGLFGFDQSLAFYCFFEGFLALL